MIEKIISALKKCGVELWRVTETTSETAELYFIKKALDIPRIKKMTKYGVVVFRDFEENGEKYRGHSNAIISIGMSEKEIEENIKSAYYAASFVKNKWFDLPEGINAEHKASDSDLAQLKLIDAAKKVAEGLFAIDTDTVAFINSAEIFVTKTVTKKLGSNGLDVSYDRYSVKGELVAQCVEPKDVEQYKEFSFDKLDIEGVQRIAAEAINDVRARARSSQPPKAGNYSILLKGENVGTVLEYYATRSAASIIYPGYSKWEVGMNVQGENIQKEKINLSLVPSEPYSAEGIPMIERPLISDGVLKTIHGGIRFCYYLGVEPTGDYGGDDENGKLSCTNGSAALADMLGEGVLELVSFSDFQMDFMDGHFMGEIRLALLHHADGSVEELTGGSINGCIIDVQDRLTFSTERYSDSTYDGPLALLIPDVSVAGM